MRAPSLTVSVPHKQVDSDSALSMLVGTGCTSALLVDLPPELFTAICAFADCRSVVRCRAVCRCLRDAIDASLELQYRIELVRDGMIDYRGRSPSGSSESSIALLTISDRLARLRRLRHAWKTLDWTRCVTVPMPGPCCAYELVGGMFCKTQPRVRRGRGRRVAGGAGDTGGFGFGWPGVGNVGVDGDDEAGHDGPHVFGSRTMSTTWLPAGRHNLGHTVMNDDLGIPTRDFAMDPSQDLMVLFKGGGEDVALPIMVVFPGTLELHIRTISTNQTHPEARAPVLCTAVMYPITSGFVQIVDDIVGMMYFVDPARPRITIWNWKTGNRVVDCSSGNLPPGTWDFSFIHSRALFLTTGNGGGSLELFSFTCDRADTDANGNANSDSDSDSGSPTPTQSQPQPRHIGPTSTLTHVATLHLPPVRPSVRVLSIGSHTGPFLAGCPPDKPFVASNEERIHVLTIQYAHLPTLDGPRTRPRVCVFVHNRALEGYLNSGAVSASASVDEAATMRTMVPWCEWGRVHARVVPHVGMFQWLRYVHGQRVVMLLPTSEVGKCTLQVLDFNVRNALDDSQGEDDVDRIDESTSKETNKDVADPSFCKATLRHVTYPTRIVMPNIFVDVVESGLPYHEARRDIRDDYSGVMIDDERLVGLKYPAFLTQDMKEIDVFTM